MNEHHLIVDWDGMQPILREQGSLIEPEPIARLLKQLARAIGGELELVALVPYTDPISVAAFEREAFRV